MPTEEKPLGQNCPYILAPHDVGCRYRALISWSEGEGEMSPHLYFEDNLKCHCGYNDLQNKLLKFISLVSLYFSRSLVEKLKAVVWLTGTVLLLESRTRKDW